MSRKPKTTAEPSSEPDARLETAAISPRPYPADMISSQVQIAGFDALPKQTVTDQGIAVEFDPADRAFFEDEATPASLGLFNLGRRATELAAQPGFDRLIGLPMVRNMELLDHQVETARTVLQQMRGRALLADEVGLGKTIEAGLVLSELMLRGLVRSVLVLTPPSLVAQWRGELLNKFAIEVITHDDPAFRQQGADAWGQYDHILASFHTAKRPKHREAVQKRVWDMVIIDEAHHLRNRNTQLWRFASQLRKRFTLLLTATPVQNHLEELYNLVTLLEPGLLSTAKRFQKQFVDKRDKLTPRNVDDLQALVSEVMVRNRRTTVGLQFTRRWAHTERVTQTEQEQTLYAAVAERVRTHLAQGNAPSDSPAANGDANGDTNAKPGRPKLTRMALITLQMALGSSPAAAAPTLEKISQSPGLSESEQARWRQLAADAAAIPKPSKLQRLLQRLDEQPDKMVVFTQFRATQDMLQAELERAGYEVAVFHGGLGRLEKEAEIRRFQDTARVLVSTDAGSEGRNLQFCHAVCNFDLPWNPQRIEQRIGRLSRIGQAHDVQVINLVADGTIEAAILHLLDAKLAMFELVIGEIDMVLSNLDESREFPDMVADLFSESSGVEDFAGRLDRLGDRLVAAKQAYQQQRAVEDKLFGEAMRPQ